MRYEPKEIEGNVNVSPTHPLKELSLLLGGAFGILIALYIALGFAVDFLAPRLPAGVEDGLGDMYSGMYASEAQTETKKKLQETLDSLAADMPGGGAGRYHVHIVKSTVVNAMALPGGNIVVFSALIDEMESENEMAFVLAHELGHFANRDHIKGLGRGLVLVVISATALGHDSDVTQFLMGSLTNVEMKFSQKQELAADSFALDLLNKRYGHVGGSSDFFARLAREKNQSRFLHYFASHPHPEIRVEVLEKRTRDEGYAVGEKSPLDAVFNTVPEEPAGAVSGSGAGE